MASFVCFEPRQLIGIQIEPPKALPESGEFRSVIDYVPPES